MTRPLSFLFTTWEGGGNVTPALVVVRRLVERGHRVRVMSEECNRPESEHAGAAFVAWTRAPSRKNRSPETQIFRDWAEATPQQGLLTVIRDVWCGPALAYARDVMDELQREPADLVVTCEGLFGVMAGCESLNQRFVILSPNISLAPLPGIPPMGPGLAPPRSDEERGMHAEVANAVQAMFDSGLPSLNDARAKLGLGALDHVTDQFKAAKVELLATSRAFDFPADPLPDRVRYVGPQIGDPHWVQSWDSPWSESDTRPLVVVGFSTTFQNHAGVLQNTIDALAALPVRVLITLGGSINAADLRAGDNCVLADSAPHSIVMREAAVVVTHGGHGTVMRSLLSRAPMLIIPHGRDQSDNAVRVTERGAGLALMPSASVGDIRDACERLLNDPSFRVAARKFGDRVAIDKENSPIVDELEVAASDAVAAA